jgi:hypothetical protein
LNQFGPATEEESELGDLVEQYQRGYGRVWYWRQVLAIVYGELYHQFRNHKRQFIAGLIRTWCLAGGLHFAAGLFLIWQHRILLGYPQYVGMTASGFPLLTLRIGKELWRNGSYSDQWDISLLLVALNVFLPLLLGRLIAASSDINPRTLLLAYATSFTVANLIWTAESVRMLLGNQPDAAGFLVSSLIALPLVPALLFLGMRGHRGRSPVSPQVKGVKA